MPEYCAIILNISILVCRIYSRGSCCSPRNSVDRFGRTEQDEYYRTLLAQAAPKYPFENLQPLTKSINALSLKYIEFNR